MMDGIEEMFVGMLAGAATGATASAKYLPWWMVPIGGVVGGWLGMAAGMLYGGR